MLYPLQIPSQLSSHLRALRVERGLSQAGLGALLGLSQARIARIEADPLSVSTGQLLRVLFALGLRLNLESLTDQAHDKAMPAVSSTDQGDW